MTSQSEKLTYSIAEAVRATTLSRSRIYQLIRSGDLHVTRLGRRTLVDAASLSSLVRGGGDHE